MYWNTSEIIPKNVLSKNNDFHLNNSQCPPEYKSNPNILDPMDVSLPLKPEDIEEFELRVFKFAASFSLTILQRSSTKTNVPKMLNLLKSYINKSEVCAKWLITQFSNF